MPIYEYACSSCEHEFEQLQKFSDPSVSDCPHCHKKGSVHRKLSTSAFHLSGGGWYSDGYGKGAAGKGAGAKSEAKSESSSGAKSEAKSESSGGAKSESKPESSSGGESKPSESKAVSATAPGASGYAA